MTILVSTHYMDEAERCHRINYISYGNLLASGTVQEVIDGAHLATFIVEGNQINAIAKALKTLPGVDQVAPFGNSLHVVGQDEQLLAQTLEKHAGALDFSYRLGETSLKTFSSNSWQTLRTTCNEPVLLLCSPACPSCQRNHSNAARPYHIWHDAWRAIDATYPVWLCHQQ